MFSHGLDRGIDSLRHGYYDPAVGRLVFETLDWGTSTGLQTAVMVWRHQLHFLNVGRPIAGLGGASAPYPITVCPGFWGCATFATGRMRHGWYASFWRTEDLDDRAILVPVRGPAPSADVTANIGPDLRPAAFVGGDGKQNVIFNRLSEGSNIDLRFFLGWYEEPAGSWQFAPSYGTHWYSTGFSYAGATHVFRHWPGFRTPPALIYSRWDRNGWSEDWPDGWSSPISPDGYSSGAHGAATAYEPYGQIHVFNGGSGSYLRHLWREASA